MASNVKRTTLVRTTIILLCVVGGLLGLSCVRAQAAVTHDYLPSPHITEVPSMGPRGEVVPSPGRLDEVHALAVDASELYVADGNGAQYRVDKFDDFSGAFALQFAQAPSLSFLHQGLAVGHGTGEEEVYVAGDEFPAGHAEGAVAVFGATGDLQGVWKGGDTPSGAFGCFECAGTAGVAVDNSASFADWAVGDVYVVDPLHAVVDVFRPQAGGKEQYVTQLRGPEPPGVMFSRPVGVAVSGFNGDVLVLEASATEVSGRRVEIFRPAAMSGQYDFVGVLTGTPAGAFKDVSAIGVDGGNGDIYVSEEGSEIVVQGTEEVSGAVAQFDAAGEYLGRLTGTPTPFSRVQGIAVDPTSHRLFVGDFNRERNLAAVDVFGPTVVIPDVTSEAVTNVGPTSATFNGVVNPDNAGAVTCQFVWSTSKAFGEVAPCSAPVADGERSIPVMAVLSGLAPDTTYFYRLQASNSNGTNPGEPVQDQTFTTPGPGIRSESTFDVAANSATLSATIDPHGAPTTYYFQYGPGTGYGADAPSPPGAAVGSGEGGVEVAQHVQGLSPGTTYHYRVVAVAELEVESGVVGQFVSDGPDQTFTTPAAGVFVLPDARTWELTSVSQKSGGLIEPIGASAVSQASIAGNALTYVTDAPNEAAPSGYASLVQVLSTRGHGSWESQDIATPHNTALGLGARGEDEYRLFSPDLSRAGVQPFGPFDPALSGEASEQSAYLRTNYTRDDPDERCEQACYRPLVTAAPGYENVSPDTAFGEKGQCPPNLVCGPRFLGATANLSHVVLQSTAALTPTQVQDGLYEWFGGRLTLLSLLPARDGGAAVAASLGSADVGGARHAISDDGSRIVWLSITPGESHLYMRDSARGETVQLDAVQGGAGSGAVSPRFQLASTDGSRVFFLDAQRLTEDSGGSEFSEGGDLYECDIVEVAGKLRCKLSDLTPLSLGQRANAEGVLGSSEDGSYVYFVANNVLAAGAVHGACQGHFALHDSMCDLYGSHDGVTTLIGVIIHEDRPDWNPNLVGLTARASPDGHWLAFMSQRSLTGYDNRDAISARRDEEVYLYDATRPTGPGNPVCASCDPSGARPIGVEYGNLGPSPGIQSLIGGSKVWAENQWLAANIPGWTPYANGQALYQSRYLSNSGRLFFNSNEALVPQDVNGTWDVYEYEPLSVGNCSSSSTTFGEHSGGCVAMLSSGASPEESAFLDASENGNDVFFLTAGKLSREDNDTSLDVYDARVCSPQSPCFEEPGTQSPPCSTEASCRPAPTPQPEIFGFPASATFSGIGNITPTPVPVSKPLTNAQKLHKALSSCSKKFKRAKKKRRACEGQARRKFAKKKFTNAKVGHAPGRSQHSETARRFH
jgi:hypothetical protein